MPIYEYKCVDCNAEKEVFKPMADIDKEERCDECLGLMKRQMSENTWNFGPKYK